MIVAAIILSAVFAAAVGAKAQNREDARTGFAAAGAGWALYPVLLAEAAVAACLPLFPRVGAIASLVLLSAFTVALVRLARADDPISCRCFGNLGTGTVGPRTFARNGALTAVAVGLLVVGAPSSIPSVAAPILAAAAGYGFARRAPRLKGHPAGIIVFTDERCGPCHLLREQVTDWGLTDPLEFIESPDEARRARVNGTPSAVRLDPTGRVIATASGAPAIEALAFGLTGAERTYEAFGVVFSVSGDVPDSVLPPGSRLHHGGRAPLARWSIVRSALYRNGLLEIRRGDGTAPLDLLEVQIRHLVAEFAPEVSFIHAGVVAWQDQAIIIPGSSYTGKSTLVAALLSAGAAYLSDEYAVIDAEGLVRSFPKAISLRPAHGQRGAAQDPAELTNATPPSEPIPVGAILTCPFDPGTDVLELAPGTAGGAAMALVANAVGIRQAPERTMAVIRAACDGATVLTGTRGEATPAAHALLRQLDRTATATSA